MVLETPGGGWCKFLPPFEPPEMKRGTQALDNGSDTSVFSFFEGLARSPIPPPHKLESLDLGSGNDSGEYPAIPWHSPWIAFVCAKGAPATGFKDHVVHMWRTLTAHRYATTTQHTATLREPTKYEQGFHVVFYERFYQYRPEPEISRPGPGMLRDSVPFYGRGHLRLRKESFTVRAA